MSPGSDFALWKTSKQFDSNGRPSKDHGWKAIICFSAEVEEGRNVAEGGVVAG
jgi:hypothetical protein